MELQILSRTENIELLSIGETYKLQGTATYNGGELKGLTVNVYLKEGEKYLGGINEDASNTNININNEGELVGVTGHYAEFKTELNKLLIKQK